MGRSLGGFGRPCDDDGVLLVGGVRVSVPAPVVDVADPDLEQLQQIKATIEAGDPDLELAQPVTQTLELTPVKAAHPSMQVAAATDNPPHLTRTMEATPAALVGTGIVDDFEDNDLAEYATHNGDSADSTTQGTTVHDGSYALEINTNGSASAHAIESTSGLARYPDPGQTFQVWLRGSPNAQNRDIEFCFATQGAGSAYFPDGYRVTVEPSNDRMRLHVVDGGNPSSIASANATLSYDTWYRLEIVWGTGGSIDVTLYDDAGNQLATMSANDSTFSDGGIAFAARPDFQLFADTCEVTA